MSEPEKSKPDSIGNDEKFLFVQPDANEPLSLTEKAALYAIVRIVDRRMAGEPRTPELDLGSDNKALAAIYAKRHHSEPFYHTLAGSEQEPAGEDLVFGNERPTWPVVDITTLPEGAADLVFPIRDRGGDGLPTEEESERLSAEEKLDRAAVLFGAAELDSDPQFVPRAAVLFMQGEQDVYLEALMGTELTDDEIVSAFADGTAVDRVPAEVIAAIEERKIQLPQRAQEALDRVAAAVRRSSEKESGKE